MTRIRYFTPHQRSATKDRLFNFFLLPLFYSSVTVSMRHIDHIIAPPFIVFLAGGPAKPTTIQVRLSQCPVENEPRICSLAAPDPIGATYEPHAATAVLCEATPQPRAATPLPAEAIPQPIRTTLEPTEPTPQLPALFSLNDGIEVATHSLWPDSPPKC